MVLLTGCIHRAMLLASQLPLKRAMGEKDEKGKAVRSTETYRVFTVDSKLDGKLFDVPPS